MLFYQSSYRSFIDSIMCFGATLEERKERVVIRISRCLEKRRTLAWMIAEMEAHGVKCHLCETSDDNKIVYRTEPLAFTLTERRRWYDGQGLRMPEDIEVNPAMLSCWLIAGLSNNIVNPNKRIPLNAPRASAQTLDTILCSADRFGVRLHIGDDAKPCIMPADKDAVLAWLNDYAPRAAWDINAAIPVES